MLEAALSSPLSQVVLAILGIAGAAAVRYILTSGRQANTRGIKSASHRKEQVVELLGIIISALIVSLFIPQEANIYWGYIVLLACVCVSMTSLLSFALCTKTSEGYHTEALGENTIK